MACDSRFVNGPDRYSTCCCPKSWSPIPSGGRSPGMSDGPSNGAVWGDIWCLNSGLCPGSNNIWKGRIGVGWAQCSANLCFNPLLFVILLRPIPVVVLYIKCTMYFFFLLTHITPHTERATAGGNVQCSKYYRNEKKMNLRSKLTCPECSSALNPTYIGRA